MKTLSVLPADDAFLGPESDEQASFEASRYVILSAPMETSVSYGGGTAQGPEAILKASQQVEFMDLETERDLLARGIATAAHPASGSTQIDALKMLSEQTEAVVRAGKVPLVLGGEHSITWGVIDGLLKARDGRGFDILHFDAHADFRNAYQGNPHSHASVMYKIFEDFPQIRFVQVGIRAICQEELELIRENPARIQTFFAHLSRSLEPRQVAQHLGPEVYVSFDVDGLDPSIMPATGTPEPGGLLWYPALDILRTALRDRQFIGGDVNELAPLAGFHGCDLLAARILCKMIAYDRDF